MADPVSSEVSQAAQQAAQAAAQNAASQVAQQIAEQVGQAVSQAIQKFMTTTGGVTEGSLGARTTSQAVGERVEDIGGGETIESNLAAHSHLMMGNMKRTYDEAQSTDLQVRLGDINQRQGLNNVALQALQNAVETANMVGKQAVKHADVAADRVWNVDEVGTLTAKSGAQSDMIQTIVAATVAATLSEINKQKTA